MQHSIPHTAPCILHFMVAAAVAAVVVAAVQQQQRCGSTAVGVAKHE